MKDLEDAKLAVEFPHREVEVGDRFKSKNGQIGEIVDVNGIKRLHIINVYGRVTQTINLKDIDLKKFERIN